jgi:lactoylglutathione lyase
MADTYTYGSVSPIGDTDPMNMPVADIDAAAAWYGAKMGFVETSRGGGETPRVVLARDDIEIGLAVNGGDPEQASCYIAVSDVKAAMADLESNGVQVSNHRIDEHSGAKYEVFFVRDDDGICYCIGQPV